jgi:hypothetical protein
VHTGASAGGGLEKFDDVAGRILEENLLAARSFDNVVAERRALRAESCDLGVEAVVDIIARPSSSLLRPDAAAPEASCDP